MTNKEKIYLGALMHDIGKFWQRTEWRKQFTAHPIFSADFMAECFPNESILFNAARYHHIKDLIKSGLTGDDRIFAEIVFEADNLASWERDFDNENREKRLLNIFSLVKNTKYSSVAPKTYQPISRLNPNDDLYKMPVSDATSNTAFMEETRQAWINFTNDFKQEVSGGANLTTLYYLCKKYLWCQTSAFYRNTPEISLFEHSRLTAAIAVCNYDYLKVRIDAGDLPASNLYPSANLGTGNVLDRGEKRYLLVLADLSGIQDYIYSIAHDNALKALKGRSFYLQQLMDGVAMHILKELDLLDAHLLYSGGGVFYLLLPNTLAAQEVLEQTQKKVAQDLLTQYHGVLSLNFAWEELAGQDFKPETIKEIWSDLSEKRLHRNKYRKDIGVLGAKDFFVDDSIPYGGVMVCDATGVELVGSLEHNEASGVIKTGTYDLSFKEFTSPNGQHYYQRPLDEDEIEYSEQGKVIDYEDAYISQEQFNSIRIGQRLKKGASEIRLLEKAEFILPGSLGLQVVNGAADRQVSKWQRAFMLNDDRFDLGSGIAKGWKFYGGNWFPRKRPPVGIEDARVETADFDYLRKSAGVHQEGDHFKGLKYLGILRMDVDNLSDIFRRGLDKPPFSRIVQLSNLVDFFFSGYLNKLKTLRWHVLHGVNPSEGEFLEESIQLIYAGGDDLCIVGKWNVLPDVAIWIKSQFAEFTGHNPALSISGGIALFGQKYPLFKAAKHAGWAEDKAKEYRRCAKGLQQTVDRNAFCFLENPLSWNDFLEVRRLVKLIYEWIEVGIETEGRNQKLPRAFVQVIQEQFFEFSQGKTVGELSPEDIKKRRYGPWRWRLAYLLSRMGGRNSPFASGITQLSVDVTKADQNTDQEYLLLLYTAALWVDFLTREQKDQEQ